MKTHWQQYLNIEQLLREAKPRAVLELGALLGENSHNLATLGGEIGYHLTIVSDDVLPDLSDVPEWVTLHQGVSYRVLPTLTGPYDVVLLDTDHNYYTLMRELDALDPLLPVGAQVIIHDVEAFYYDPGFMPGYADGSSYPRDEIVASTVYGSLGTGLIDFLATHKRGYRLVRWIPEGCGVAVIRKNPVPLMVTVTWPVSWSDQDPTRALTLLLSTPDTEGRKVDS